jgi:dienelactone hydrolase
MITRPAACRDLREEVASRRTWAIKAFSASGTTKHYNEFSRLIHSGAYTGAVKLIGASLMLFAPLFAIAQSSQPGPVQILEFPSGNLHLKGYFWRPAGAGPFPAILFNHGSGGADPMQTAGMPMSEAAETLAPIFLKHGYAFFYPCRRGHGLSADQGEFIQDALKKEEVGKGVEARQKLQFALLVGPHLDDTVAALSFLKSVPGIDAHRIALVGHSFGGQLALIDSGRDNALRAVVTFGAAANSWAKSADLRKILLEAATRAKAAIMLIHAANDYDTTPGKDLSAELERLHKAHVLKIYPAIGKTSDDAHNLAYNSVPVWENDVFRFLDDNVRP